MFSGGFRRRWTLRWVVGRLITSAVIGLLFVAADYAQGQEPASCLTYSVSVSGLPGSSPKYTPRYLDPQDAVDDLVQQLNTFYSGRNYQESVVGEINTVATVNQPGSITIVYSSQFGPNEPYDGNMTASSSTDCELECEAGLHVDIPLDFGPQVANPSMPSEYEDSDGCMWDKVGVSLCLMSKQSDGSPGANCLFSYESRGEQGSGPTEPDGGGGGTPVDSPYTEPTKTESNSTAPDAVENADGSTTTTTTTTENRSGGGRGSLTSADGGYGVTIQGSSSNTTTTTVVNNSYSTGGESTTKTVTNTWKNGDTTVINITQSGGVSSSSSEGASGGGSTTTTTETNPDGSSSSSSESTGNGGDASGDANCASGGQCSPDTPGGGGGSGGEGEGEGEGSGPPGTYIGDGAPDLDENVPGFGDTFTTVWDGFNNAPIVDAVNGLGDGVPAGPGSCPKPSFTVFDESYTIDAHCQLLDQVKPVLSVVFKAVWSLAAVLLLFTA